MNPQCPGCAPRGYAHDFENWLRGWLAVQALDVLYGPVSA